MLSCGGCVRSFFVPSVAVALARPPTPGLAVCFTACAVKCVSVVFGGLCVFCRSSCAHSSVPMLWFATSKSVNRDGARGGRVTCFFFFSKLLFFL